MDYSCVIIVVIIIIIIVVVSYHVLYDIVDYMLPQTSCAFSNKDKYIGIHIIKYIGRRW